MIITVTFSPSIDYVMDVENLRLGEINRSSKEVSMPGGKGINVSIVLSHLGRKSLATGFVGGYTGAFIKQAMREENIEADFVELKGDSRINVKIRGGKETAINGQGPKIEEEDIEALIKKLEGLTKDDVLVISGAIPSTLPNDVYERILERLEGKGIPTVIDSTKEVLLKTLRFHPLLVKPNDEELGEMFGAKIENEADLRKYSDRLREMGAENVIVSLGGKGAYLNAKGVDPLLLEAPKGHVVNTVGAGDSLVAGFLDEYLRSNNVVRAFQWGIATGSASAFSEGLAEKKDVETLFETIK